MNIDRMDNYDWSVVGGQPTIEVGSFSTLHNRNVYADVCKAEQLMADTLQHRRCVALVAAGPTGGEQVIDYIVCQPDPNSTHRVR